MLTILDLSTAFAAATLLEFLVWKENAFVYVRTLQKYVHSLVFFKFDIDCIQNANQVKTLQNAYMVSF